MSMRSLRMCVIAVTAALGFAACGDDAPSAATSTLLGVQDIVVGEGDPAVAGDVLTVHYTGHFVDGPVFDSSVDREPFTFRLGAGSVIRGWDIGLVGMRVGGQRKLIVPPALAYGSSGSGPIPPDTTLVFEIELLANGGR
jgi:FKBP-type peptidyl-prolyl cis-trans isomerase